MPNPSLGAGLAYEGPPPEIMAIDPKLFDYLLMLHARLFGIPTGSGDLDDVNVNGASLTLSSNTTYVHSNLATVTAFQHHGATGHDALLKATASTDATASTVSLSNNQSAVSVTSADSTDLPTVITLANEIKADVNTLVSNFNTAETEIRGDVNQIVTDLNAVKDSLNNLKAVMRTANLLAT